MIFDRNGVLLTKGQRVRIGTTPATIQSIQKNNGQVEINLRLDNTLHTLPSEIIALCEKQRLLLWEVVSDV